MGETFAVEPAMLLLAAFSRHDEALDWAAAKAEATWGPIALASERFDFRETNYYEASMGPALKKCFWAFDQLIDPGAIVDIKLATNAWEAEYAALGKHGESRPLNLDPGYITPAKLVLASTKDHAHRLYLAQGIYAEVTLSYQHSAWRPHSWTFPDYRREDYQAFFTRCRDAWRARR